MGTVACRGIHRRRDPQIVIYTDKHNPLLLTNSMQLASTYKNGPGTQSAPAILWAEYRQERRNLPQLWVSSKHRSSADYFWSNCSDKQTKTACSQRERGREGERKKVREEEEPQSVKHNLVTPFCHGYTWTRAAADLLVQMMKKQNKTEIFLPDFDMLFKWQAGKKLLPKNILPPSLRLTLEHYMLAACKAATNSIFRKCVKYPGWKHFYFLSG